MPVSLGMLFRLFVALAICLWMFLMYCTARTWDAFGWTPGHGTLSLLFALAMLVPLAWVAFVLDLPEIIVAEVRGRRRWGRGRCAACGYQLGADDDRCSECGEPVVEPKTYRVSRSSVLRFLAICSVAWIVGCGIGEAWVQADERSFVREAEYAGATTPSGRYTRERRWPNEGAWLLFDPAIAPHPLSK